LSATRQWEGQAVSNGNNYVILEIAMITDDLEVTISCPKPILDSMASKSLGATVLETL
jgi:hypothetical protein